MDYERLIASSTRVGKCLICHLTPSQVYANIKGYGKAHRFVWEHHNGPIPPGMKVCHECDTPRCIEITCLFLGTADDNMKDKVAKGRQHFGGPGKTLTEDEITQARKLYEDGYTLEDIGAAFNVSRRTISRSISLS
jgi:HNH endonuclease/Helix-turn-helix domain